MMWNVLAKSVQGSSHKRLQTVCQDACQTEIHHVGGLPVLVLAASDGAGSAEHSDIGSQTACRAVQELIAEKLRDQTDFLPIARDEAVSWYEHVRAEILREAEVRSVPIRQLACTLLVAVIGESGAAFCQIGDGAIVVRDQGELRPVFWPQSGEYANTTNFVTSSRIEQDLMFEWRAAPIDDVSMFTDGLQTVALNYATRQAHQPFFTPLLDTLRQHVAPAELLGPLQSFLESKNLTDRTDDDLTLILATRINSV
ncbi:MAG: hypothetical protein JWP89_512 [Schlesneria sp.]|nr:hypothetical protein [Schlesneria sp.]